MTIEEPKSWEKRTRESDGTIELLLFQRPVSLAAKASLWFTYGVFALTLGFSVGGGPEVCIAPFISFALGLLILAGMRARAHSKAACRVVFYSFTAPAWLFCLWLVVERIKTG